VTNGIYQTGGRAVYGTATNRVTVDKAVTVQSVNGSASTLILGNLRLPSIRGAYLTNGATLIGFTLTNCGTPITGDIFREQSGGGVWSESSSAVISNCIMTGSINGRYGGGAYQGTLFNCVLTNNSVSFGGGGAASNSLFNCTLTRNSISPLSNGNFGGGAYGCVLSNCLLVGNQGLSGGGSGGGAAFSALTGCVISNNIAGNSGGGLYLCIANSSLISSNRASLGGGAYSNVLNNCVLKNNFTSGNGAGAYNSALINCTVVSNTASPAGSGGGGVYGGGVTNSIIYYNTGGNIVNTKLVRYNCAIPFAGDFGITNEPAFVNLANGDFRWQSNSPCINAGNNSYVTNTTDFDGNPRIVGGMVDIGAYEFQSPSSVLSYAWAQQYGLPTDGSADYLDSDGDGLNNWQEWIAGTAPNNPASLLFMLTPAATNSSGLTVSWQSVSGKNYLLQRSTNLSAQPPFSLLRSNILGQPGLTTYTDTNAIGNGPFFYRVGVQ
jgi:hypothetical protein